jgi:hypothetical protein
LLIHFSFPSSCIQYKKIEVINVVPREHWDTIHDPKQEDQEDGQGFIKRADD